MSSNKIITQNRNAGIDLLRGLSIVLVVMHHVGLRIQLKQGALATFIPNRFLNALIYNGYESVFIFFVISGFLITSNSLTRWGSLAKIDVKSFYVRRAARIIPCLFILVAVLSVLHLTGAKNYTISHQNQSLPGAIVSAIGLHLNWYEGVTGYLPGNWDVLWSLSIEEVFYLCFPLICLLVRRNRILVPLLFFFAISLPYTRGALAGNEIWQEKAYLPGMSAIALGVLGALLAAQKKLPKQWIIISLKIIGVLGIITVFCYEDILWRLIGNGATLVLTFSALCLILSFHWQANDRTLKVIPGTGWLRSFGKLSYEVYLTHMFVVYTVVQIFKAYDADLWWGIFWYIPVLVFSWGLGWLVANYISIPSERAIHRLVKKYSS
jgi:peptidoglycan/LPS O-acetylase OafA/YrhL